MIRTITISLGKANIGEVYLEPRRRVKECCWFSQPESGPQEARLDPVGEVGDGGGRLAGGERQVSPKRPAPPLGRKLAQPDLVAITGARDRPQLADTVDQPALHCHAPGQDVAVEQRVVRSVDLAGAKAAKMILEGAMDVP